MLELNNIDEWYQILSHLDLNSNILAKINILFQTS